jgi:hypothetical protein
MDCKRFGLGWQTISQERTCMAMKYGTFFPDEHKLSANLGHALQSRTKRFVGDEPSEYLES